MSSVASYKLITLSVIFYEYVAQAKSELINKNFKILTYLFD